VGRGSAVWNRAADRWGCAAYSLAGVSLACGSRPYLTLFGAVAIAVWLARWRAATVGAIAGFLIANYFWPGRRVEFVFDEFFVFELAGYALSAGFIIFFGETMHRAREREGEQKNLLAVTLASIAMA